MSSSKNQCTPYLKEDSTLDKRPVVSVVVPAFNEAGIIEKNLTILCKYMGKLENQYEWEIIVVNDGSSDNTGDIAEAYAKKCEKMKVLHHPFNFRLGQALRYAFGKCRGDYVVVMDLDLSYSPDHIELMVAKIIQTRAKIVIASPYRKGGSIKNVPWLRKKLSLWANRFLCLTATRDKFSDRFTTITGMVRCYDAEFLSKLNLRAMDVEINPEIIYKAMILRARIVEIPAHLDWGVDVAHKKKSLGEKRRSSLRILTSIIESLVSGFIFRPFMFFILPGLLLMLLSFYPIFWIFWHTTIYYKEVVDTSLSVDFRLSDAIGIAFDKAPHAFIVGGVALIVSIQLISLGLLALQKKRYFDELFHINSVMCHEAKKKVRS